MSLMSGPSKGNDKKDFSAPQTIDCINFGFVRMYVTQNDIIYIRFGTKLIIHIVGFPVGTNCAPLDFFYL